MAPCGVGITGRVAIGAARWPLIDVTITERFARPTTAVGGLVAAAARSGAVGRGCKTGDPVAGGVRSPTSAISGATGSGGACRADGTGGKAARLGGASHHCALSNTNPPNNSRARSATSAPRRRRCARKGTAGAEAGAFSGVGPSLRGSGVNIVSRSAATRARKRPVAASGSTAVPASRSTGTSEPLHNQFTINSVQPRSPHTVPPHRSQPAANFPFNITAIRASAINALIAFTGPGRTRARYRAPPTARFAPDT